MSKKLKPIRLRSLYSIACHLWMPGKFLQVFLFVFFGGMIYEQ